jgi:hypothetical protein
MIHQISLCRESAAMLRPKPIDNRAKAASYFGKTNGGDYLNGASKGEELRRE